MFRTMSSRRLVYTTSAALTLGTGTYLALKQKGSVYAEHPRMPDISTFKTLPTRAEMIQRMKSGDEYDLVIVGGGATGTGCAVDAATRGLKVALVERDDYAAGTSSRSTKLVHGGVRYLEKAFKVSLAFDVLGLSNHFRNLTMISTSS